MGLADIIYELRNDKGLSEDLVKIVIEDFLKAAYKKRFNRDDNTLVKFSSDNSEVALYSKKTIVADVYDPVSEISLEEAKTLEPECELEDQLLIEINPQDFTRNEIMVANQRALHRIREFEGDSLQSEFKNKIGEIVVGYYLREVNNNIIVDLGKVEGTLPKKFQSPKEVYRVGDRIKALVHSVDRANGNKLDVVLSRTHTDFVKKIFELEVPELYDGAVEIMKIVREPGYRTKIAVRSLYSEIDPIGICVGTKGSRINNVVLELDNERIDMLRYDSDPLTFIHNALSPADVKQVIVTDYAKRNALAVVEDGNFPIAIGKLGLNVRLANRLTDWNINVKSESEFKEMDESNQVGKIFFEESSEKIEEEIDISKVSELPGLDNAIIEKLTQANIIFIEDLIQLSNSNLIDKGFTNEDISHIRKLLKEVIEIEEHKESNTGTLVESENSEQTSVKDNTQTLEEDADGENTLLRDISSLKVSTVSKLESAGIKNLYDLVVMYSSENFNSLIDFTSAEKEEIEKFIKENVEYEE